MSPITKLTFVHYVNLRCGHATELFVLVLVFEDFIFGCPS